MYHWTGEEWGGWRCASIRAGSLACCSPLRQCDWAAASTAGAQWSICLRSCHGRGPV